jgi:ATP-dependent Clp protease ATP-binding subunit ClpC
MVRLSWRMTDRARKVMRLANDRAVQFLSPCVFPGHVLLGMMDEGCGVAAVVLCILGVSSNHVTAELEPPMPVGINPPARNALPLDMETEQLLTHAVTECRWFGHNYIGTEHLLLALTHSQNKAVHSVLSQIGPWQEMIRREVLAILGHAA